jgi:hypothetical protein
VAAKHALANVAARARPDFNKRFYVDINTATSMGIVGACSRSESTTPMKHLTNRYRLLFAPAIPSLFE